VFRPSSRAPELMRRPRTTARGILFLTFALLAWPGTAAASPDASDGVNKVPRLIFPVIGDATYIDDFGDARGQGSHEANDLMAAKRSLAVAVEAGKVKFWTTSSRAGCMLYLDGESGTQYLYIHLNNDLTPANDNRGKCVPGVAFADGLKSGARVGAGEPVGFVGDSGDADGIASHLHFEVHPNGGAAVSPYPYLRKARRLLFAAKPGSLFTLALSGKVVSVAGEELRLELEQVRSWPGGRRIEHSGQKVAVSVPPTASIEGAIEPLTLASPTVGGLGPGTTVTVFTTPAKTTLAAQTGARNALSAKRVVVKK
jgi:hypothetical protein